MIPKRYGATFNEAGGFDVIRICGDEDLGGWWMLRTKRQQVELRVTKTGLIRLGPVQKATEHPRIDAP